MFPFSLSPFHHSLTALPLDDTSYSTGNGQRTKSKYIINKHNSCPFQTLAWILILRLRQYHWPTSLTPRLISACIILFYDKVLSQTCAPSPCFQFQKKYVYIYIYIFHVKFEVPAYVTFPYHMTRFVPSQNKVLIFTPNSKTRRVSNYRRP